MAAFMPAKQNQIGPLQNMQIDWAANNWRSNQFPRGLVGKECKKFVFEKEGSVIAIGMLTLVHQIFCEVEIQF